MVLKHFQNKSTDKQEPIRPAWVSEANATLRAWESILTLKEQKSEYIKNHSKSGDFLTQKNFQISGAEVARALTMNRATLMNTSTYSAELVAFLNSVNANLAKLKDERLKSHCRSRSRGPIEKSKPDLVLANTELRKRIAQLEHENTAALVREALDGLPLPIRRKLGLK